MHGVENKVGHVIFSRARQFLKNSLHAKDIARAPIPIRVRGGGGGGGGGERSGRTNRSQTCVIIQCLKWRFFLTEFRYLIFFSEIKGHLTIKKSSPFSYTSAYQT